MVYRPRVLLTREPPSIFAALSSYRPRHFQLPEISCPQLQKTPYIQGPNSDLRRHLRPPIEIQLLLYDDLHLLLL
jgi:hypothetical protein